jgi:hypothetical protein
MTQTTAPALTDALAFVLAMVDCTECSLTKDDTEVIGRYCFGCGATGCDCVLTEDPHADDLFWCEDCRPVCGCDNC